MKRLIAVLLSLALLTLGLPALAAIEEGTELVWNEQTFRVAGVAEGDAVDAGGSAAEGRFIEIRIDTDMNLLYGELNDFKAQLTLSGASGASYAPVSASGTLGESVSMDKLNTAHLSDVAVRFDVPKEVALQELSLCVNGAVVGGTGASGVSEELVGDWTGSGEPVGGGSAIALKVTVNADGTGSYVFEQAGYTESYPVAFTSADNQFTVEIPADNKLNIVRCGGSYAYADGVLTLNITTTFANGRTFEYVAECEKLLPSVTLSYEGTPYALTFESAQVVDGALNVAASGFGSIMHMRNGQIVVPFWAYVMKGGEKYDASSVNCDASGVYTYTFGLAELPDEVYLYSVEDEKAPVLLKSGGFAADAPQTAENALPAELLGAWRLDGIDFLTPEDNDIFSIDAGMTMGGGMEGNALTLNGDGSMSSDVNIDALVAAVAELPFETQGLNFGEYADWRCDGDALALSPNGAALKWRYDETADALDIEWADEVEIQSVESAAGTSKSGVVQMQITLNFLRADESAPTAADDTAADAPAAADDTAADAPTAADDTTAADDAAADDAAADDSAQVTAGETVNWRGINLKARFLCCIYDNMSQIVPPPAEGEVVLAFFDCDTTTLENVYDHRNDFVLTNGHGDVLADSPIMVHAAGSGEELSAFSVLFYVQDYYAQDIAAFALNIQTGDAAGDAVRVTQIPVSDFDAETIGFIPAAEAPTAEPTAAPTIEPTAEPTVEPTIEPTVEPTVEPTAEPTAKAEAAAVPTEEILALFHEPLYDATREYLSAGNTIAKGENSEYGKGLQTLLVALGCGISVDGQIGNKSVSALNTVYAALGRPESGETDAAAFDRLLLCLACVQYEDDAYTILTNGGMTEDEITYLRACGLQLAGLNYQAYQAFCLTEYTLTINTSVSDPTAGGVDSEYESYEDF